MLKATKTKCERHDKTVNYRQLPPPPTTFIGFNFFHCLSPPKKKKCFWLNLSWKHIFLFDVSAVKASAAAVVVMVVAAVDVVVAVASADVVASQYIANEIQLFRY